MSETKHCSKCKTLKPLTEFYRREGGRFKSECKTCNLEAGRRWKKANADTVRAATKRYQKRHPDRVRAYRRKRREATLAYNRKRHYGITPDEFNAMVAAQNGLCAICEDRLDLGRHTHVDHCHESKRVRGILCRRCNLMIGQGRSTAIILRKAADYVERTSR